MQKVHWYFVIFRKENPSSWFINDDRSKLCTLKKPSRAKKRLRFLWSYPNNPSLKLSIGNRLVGIHFKHFFCRFFSPKVSSFCAFSKSIALSPAHRRRVLRYEWLKSSIAMHWSTEGPVWSVRVWKRIWTGFSPSVVPVSAQCKGYGGSSVGLPPTGQNWVMWEGWFPTRVKPDHQTTEKQDRASSG